MLSYCFYQRNLDTKFKYKIEQQVDSQRSFFKTHEKSELSYMRSNAFIFDDMTIYSTIYFILN